MNRKVSLIMTIVLTVMSIFQRGIAETEPPVAHQIGGESQMG